MKKIALKNKKMTITQPIVEILKAEYDFGDIKQGEKATHNYKIKNIGNADLLISSAKGSCGCTVPEWPKDPIKPVNDLQLFPFFERQNLVCRVKKHNLNFHCSLGPKASEANIKQSLRKIHSLNQNQWQ